MQNEVMKWNLLKYNNVSLKTWVIIIQMITLRMNAVEGLTTLVNNTTHVFFSKSTKDRSS